MRPPDDQVLHVVMNGRMIGEIQRTGSRRMRLRYSADTSPRFTPLSVTMPGPIGRYRERVLEPWLSGLLPDRPETVRQWRRQFGITDSSVFTLLQHVGEDVAGAAQFVRPERLNTVLASPGQLEPLDQSPVAEMLRRALADLPVSPGVESRGKFSLAGAQAKIALHRAEGLSGDFGWSDPSGSVPSTHVLKPAIPGLPDQDLIEAVTLRTASDLGLLTAPCWIEEFASDRDVVRAIVVTRFDRARGADGLWSRVHQEDMGQALGSWPDQKYESQGGPNAAAIAKLIRTTSHQPSQDLARFAAALVFNWLVCGTDAHARNYSLVLRADEVRLAPLYDLNSHLGYSNGVGSQLSMSVNGDFEAARITVDDWVRFAPALYVEPEWLRAEIGRQRENLLAAMTKAAATPDVARYDSEMVDRLLDNTQSWVTRVS